MRTGTFIKSGLLCLGIVALGALIVAFAFMMRTNGTAAQAVTPSEQKSAFVKVKVLEPQLLEDRLVLTGDIEPWGKITISAEGSGTLELQNFEEGDAVRQGEELYRIDAKMIKAQMDQVRARLNLALQEFERADRLAKQGAGSSQTLDAARATRDAAEAELRSLEIQLERSVITAPFDGVVDKVFKKREEYVDPGAPLVQLVQVHKVKFVAGVPERDIAHIQLGNSARATIEALGERTFEGKVFRIAATAEESTRTFPTEIELDNADGLLKPGMIGRITFIRQSFPNAIVIPIFSVLTLEDQHFAVVEENDVARMRPVKIGILSGELVQVIDGLSEGDHLIVAGQRDIKDGEAVRVQEVVQ